MYDNYLEELRDEGFYFSDERLTGHSKAKIEHYIPIMGFPRFRDYVKPFKKIAATGPDTVGIDNVLRLYRFDRKLRLLTLDAVERIEISLKCKVDKGLVQAFGDKWHTNEELLNSFKGDLFGNIRADVQRTPIWNWIQNTGRTYADFPIDRVLDSLTFGRVEILFQNLPKEQRIEIAASYKVKTSILLKCRYKGLK